MGPDNIRRNQNGKCSELDHGHQRHRCAGGANQHCRSGAEEGHLGQAADQHSGGRRLDGTHAGGVLRLLSDQGYRGGVVYGGRRGRAGVHGGVCSHVRLRQAHGGYRQGRQTVIRSGKRCRSVVYSLTTPTP